MKKGDLVKSISAKLSSLAKEQSVPYQNIATAFMIERLLARLLTDPKLTKALIFKGGYVGLRVYQSPRYTIDLDALLVNADIEKTLKQTAKAIENDIDDGVWFTFESQIDLKTQGEYGGIRQVYRVGIGEVPKSTKRAQTINFDIGIGDPVTPGPIKMKTSELIGAGELSWQVYPIETIVAEKLQTLIERGGNNSRAKDIYDLYFYVPKAQGQTLRTAINRCFDFRGTPMPDEMPNLLSGMDLTLLKRGWKSATASLKEAPRLDDAFQTIIAKLRELLPNGKKHK